MVGVTIFFKRQKQNITPKILYLYNYITFFYDSSRPISSFTHTSKDDYCKKRITNTNAREDKLIQKKHAYSKQTNFITKLYNSNSQCEIKHIIKDSYKLNYPVTCINIILTIDMHLQWSVLSHCLQVSLYDTQISFTSLKSLRLGPLATIIT